MSLCVLHMGPGLRIFVSLFFPLCHLPPPFAAANLRPGAEQKVVFITARVHPGETPSSFVCQGECLHCHSFVTKMKDQTWFPMDALAGYAEFCWSDRSLSSCDVFFFFFSHGEDTRRLSHLYPAVCLFEVSGNTLSLRLVNVSKIWSELDSGHWGYSGRLDSLTCTYAMWSHTAPFCRKTSWESSESGSPLFFLAFYYFQYFFHCKAMALVLRCNSEQPLFVWSCCSEERSTQWPTAVLCTKHSC